MSAITGNSLFATPTPSAAAQSAAQTAASDPTSNASLTSEDTFLKLLVAQIQNQDPTSPTDPTQFVAQLTQYSELEQLISINGNTTAAATSAATAAATSATTAAATAAATAATSASMSAVTNAAETPQASTNQS
jgi:flagellar basal-body rod modification protein FlgD